MIDRESLFALETVLMAVLLSIAGWASVEIVSLNKAMAAAQAEQRMSNEAVGALSNISQTLARMEEGQLNLKEGLEDTRQDIKELSRHVRDLHLQQ